MRHSRVVFLAAAALVFVPALAWTQTKTLTKTSVKPSTPVASLSPTVVAPTLLGAAPVVLKSPIFLQIRGAQLKTNLNKQISLEGFYANTSIPMLVDDITRLDMDMVLPPEAYIPLVGALPANLKYGDKVKLTATLVAPSATMPAAVQGEMSVAQLAGGAQIQVLAPTTRLIPKLVDLRRKVLVLPHKYAVLIAGGANAANSHLRYWNDLKTMYTLLTSSGYAASNIKVIYADGTARTAGMPVDYSASKANIATVFSDLAGKMTGADSLYVMLNDHGGGFLNPGIGSYGIGNYSGIQDIGGEETDPAASEAALAMDLNGDGDRNDNINYDETLALWGVTMTDDEFKTEVNKITQYKAMVIQMKQCFSGGFVTDLAGPRRIVLASTTSNQVSWSEQTNGNFGEFTYWYMAALLGQKPDGTGAVNADTNGDGKVSIGEAYNYARSQDRRPETPTFSNGTSSGSAGAIPLTGTSIAAGTFL